MPGAWRLLYLEQPTGIDDTGKAEAGRFMVSTEAKNVFPRGETFDLIFISR